MLVTSVQVVVPTRPASFALRVHSSQVRAIIWAVTAATPPILQPAHRAALHVRVPLDTDPRTINGQIVPCVKLASTNQRLATIRVIVATTTARH
ncbi:MAG: hypothetical protein ACO3PX_10935 [bacterium]